MRKWLGMVACVCLVVLAVATRAMALDAAINALLHHDLEKKVLVVHDSNLEEIQKLATEPKKWTICDLQFSPEALTPERAKVIIDWVQAGGSVWFQDSRMAATFGMEADPLHEDEITQKQSEKAPYNTHKEYKGLAAVCFNVGNHDVLESVVGVAAFLIPVGKDEFSAVKAGGDVVGLLRAIQNPESTNADKMVAAMRPMGAGTVVFKPLVWEESLSSDRFQANLREWVNGYPVPKLENYGGKPAGRREDAPALSPTPGPKGVNVSAALDRIVLDTGESVAGIVQNRSFQFYNTGDMHGEDGLDRANLLKIDFQGAGSDIVTLKDGKTVTGLLQLGDEDLVVKLKDGSTQHYRKSQLKHIEFAPAAPVPETKHGQQ